MEVNEIAALQDFDKIQLSKIIEKVFIYEPGRMEISWKMDDIFYKEEKHKRNKIVRRSITG